MYPYLNGNLFSAKNSHIKSDLPRPEDFSKALYTLDTGQNDLHAGITSMAEEQVKTYIPYIIDELVSAIKVCKAHANVVLLMTVLFSLLHLHMIGKIACFRSSTNKEQGHFGFIILALLVAYLILL